MEFYTPAPGDPEPPTLVAVIASERAAFGSCTDLAKCDADPQGDGDQSPLPSSVSPSHKALVTAWAQGSSVSVLVQAPMSMAEQIVKLFKPERAASFARSCAFGDAPAVELALQAAGEGPQALQCLLETRVTPFRVSPLHCVVVGSKLLGLGDGGGVGALPSSAGSAAPPNHPAVAALLLRAGARADPRDIRGCTPLHLATSLGWTPESLQVAAVLLRHGASPDARDRSKRVALMESAMAVSPASSFLMPPGPFPKGEAALPPARLLLEAGADPSLKDADGVSSLTLLAAACMMPAPHAFMELVSSASRRGRMGVGRTQEGDEVTLVGLKAEAMNGRAALCGSFDAIKGRYTVTLAATAGSGSDASAGKVFAVKPENVGKVGGAAVTPFTACSACGKSKGKGEGEGGALLQCSRCKDACYCSVECQRADWKVHKKGCKEAAAVGGVGTVFLRAVSGRGPIVLSGHGGGGGGGGPQAKKQWDLSTFRGKEVIKVQQSIASPLGGPQLPLLLYSESKAFAAYVGKDEQPAHAKLLQLMGQELKVFVVAEKAEGGLEIVLKKLPHLPW